MHENVIKKPILTHKQTFGYSVEMLRLCLRQRDELAGLTHANFSLFMESVDKSKSVE